MIKRHILTSLVILLALTVAGCNDNKKGPSITRPAALPPANLLKTPFKDPITPAPYELPSQALATWRDYAEYRPALVLFSIHPLLKPIPEARKKGIHQLLSQGVASEIVDRARTLSNDPAILPPEAVSAAIDNGFISELILVLPSLKKPEELDLEDFRKQALGANFLTETEAVGFTLQDGVISGMVRGLPIRIVHPERLPKIDKPAILHIDLGFLKGMYVNEVKTPAYDILYQIANTLSNANYATLATTLSFSNQEIGFSLESRFLIRDIGTILATPSLLQGNTPESWTLRSKSLFATTMFKEKESRDLTLQAVVSTPDDAAALYALALDLFEQKQAEKGFAALDQAVTLDKGYGLEYLELSKQGFSMGRRDKGIELLEKAAQTLENNPFIRMELANQLIQASRVKEARPIIAELRNLDWSTTFYPDVPSYLKQMDEAAAVDVILPKTTQGTLPAENRPKKPASGMPGFNHMGMGVPGQ